MTNSIRQTVKIAVHHNTNFFIPPPDSSSHQPSPDLSRHRYRILARGPVGGRVSEEEETEEGPAGVAAALRERRDAEEEQGQQSK